MFTTVLNIVVPLILSYTMPTLQFNKLHSCKLQSYTLKSCILQLSKYTAVKKITDVFIPVLKIKVKYILSNIMLTLKPTTVQSWILQLSTLQWDTLKLYTYTLHTCSVHCCLIFWGTIHSDSYNAEERRIMYNQV